MRLAAKWQTSWTMVSPGIDQERVESIRLGDECVDLLRLGHGDPLVLVPGLAGSWKLVLPLARSLARHFQVFVYGLRGDRSPWGGPDEALGRVSDIGEHANDLARLIEKLDLRCPAVLGVSFGGAIALEFAAEHPRRLGALIVHGAEARFRSTMGSTIARRVLERSRCRATIDSSISFSISFTARSPSQVRSSISWSTASGKPTRASWPSGLLNWNRLTSRIGSGEIDVPTLIVAGGPRRRLYRCAGSKRLAEAIAGARFQSVENAGHIGFLTHQAELVRNIRRHLHKVKAAV